MKAGFSEQYQKLGLNIAYYRKQKKWSQECLAEKIDVSRTHVSRIETGDCAVSLDTLFTISSVLNVPPEKLFEFR